jgi:hypothetical protein
MPIGQYIPATNYLCKRCLIQGIDGSSPADGEARWAIGEDCLA